MTYGKALQKILNFQVTGVVYEWNRNDDSKTFLDDDNWTALPPDKHGFTMNLLSFRIAFEFDIRENITHLPRKKKKKLALHYNKKYNKLKRMIDVMEE